MPVYTIEWRYRKGGGQPDIREYPESASQTFKAGAILVYDTSDEAVKAAVDTVVQMRGLAEKDASGVTGKAVPVLVPTPLDVFSATVSNAGANLAAAHDADNIDKKYSWILSTETGQTTKLTIDEADAGNLWVVIEDLDPRDPAGTAGGRVYFRFLNTPLEGGAVA